MTRDRATSPVVGKALETGIVVLYVGLLSTTLFGGVVPDSQARTGDAIAERTLTAAASDVERSVPPQTGTGSARVAIASPETIAGTGYELRGDGNRLVLVHPDRAVGGTVRPVLPDRVVAVRGSVRSRQPAVAVASTTNAGVVIELREGHP
ncbi:hypothetical protein BRD17_04070 [Halobacteriales archaeon SW_7_68_16]|nr:MAG: hypothetical protein BRD17_04070 [Halobacteriales archaeon SW_7_68_16]